MLNNFVQRLRKKAVETRFCLHGLFEKLYVENKVYAFFQKNEEEKNRRFRTKTAFSRKKAGKPGKSFGTKGNKLYGKRKVYGVARLVVRKFPVSVLE